jgi:hypothetical protein
MQGANFLRFQALFWKIDMSELATDPLTLGHTAITLIAIALGLLVLGQMLVGQYCSLLTALFLVFTVLTSATGFLFTQTGPQPTPAQLIGAISLVMLAVALYALYGRALAGVWRAIYIVTSLVALWFNVAILVIQTFVKIPALHALDPGNPPAGLLFSGAQGALLIAFLLAGWISVKHFRPTLN